eukprot:7376557-Prymnesium_polylepis.2
MGPPQVAPHLLEAADMKNLDVAGKGADITAGSPLRTDVDEIRTGADGAVAAKGPVSDNGGPQQPNPRARFQKGGVTPFSQQGTADGREEEPAVRDDGHAQ